MKKKNKLMRTGGILLVLTLITACFAGGTFAKYVTTGEGSDTARVAKWGVEVKVTGNGFKTTYGKDDPQSNVTGDTVVGNGSESISFTWDTSGSKTENVSNVLAPGTKGTFGGITITGKPEVAVAVETTADVVLTGWNIGDSGEFYCPLVFHIGDETICGLHYSSTDAGGEGSFEAAIKKAIQDATTKELEAGTDLRKVGNNITYSWEWPFENTGHTNCNTAASLHVRDQNDTLDTKLGDNALGGDGATIPAILINVTTTVTQID